VLNGALEIAAYCSLTVAMTLLIIRLFWPKLAPKAAVLRFRRRLGKFDTVLESWAEEFKAQDEGKRHEQTHPERTDLQDD
jgi:hypothetical protein